MSAAKHEGQQGLIALFTATPQLSESELRQAQRRTAKSHRRERWQTRWRVNALYHEAMAAAANAQVAMLDGEAMDRAKNGAAHYLFALRMIDMIDRYFSIPFAQGKTEKIEAITLTLASTASGLAPWVSFSTTGPKIH